MSGLVGDGYTTGYSHKMPALACGTLKTEINKHVELHYILLSECQKMPALINIPARLVTLDTDVDALCENQFDSNMIKLIKVDTSADLLVDLKLNEVNGKMRTNQVLTS